MGRPTAVQSRRGCLGTTPKNRFMGISGLKSLKRAGSSPLSVGRGFFFVLESYVLPPFSKRIHICSSTHICTVSTLFSLSFPLSVFVQKCCANL